MDGKFKFNPSYNKCILNINIGIEKLDKKEYFWYDNSKYKKQCFKMKYAVAKMSQA